jgi:hypothetical protein
MGKVLAFHLIRMIASGRLALVGVPCVLSGKYIPTPLVLFPHCSNRAYRQALNVHAEGLMSVSSFCSRYYWDVSREILPRLSSRPTEPSSSSTTRMAGTISLVAQTPRKTSSKKMPWWSAFRDESLQISARTPGPGGSDATGFVVETESDSESDTDVAGATMQHPVLLLPEASDAASEVRHVTHSANRTRAKDVAAGKPTFDVASQHSTRNTDSFEIPETVSDREDAVSCTSFGGESHG